MPATLVRVFLSLATIAIVGLLNALLRPTEALMAAEMAGLQLQNTDTAYVASTIGMSIAMRLTITGTAVTGLLLLIWSAPLLRAWRAGLALSIPLALGVFTLNPAYAYYDKSDYTEAVTIYPNETAFWIPDSGGNKDSQGKMDSADYYQSNRVPLKRFIVPHTQLSGSGWGPWGNFYVPAGRLLLVDRTPFNQEWVKAQGRGSSTRDESFPCQDNQGHDVTVEVAIGTSVSEEAAARFLYYFGIKPPAGDRNRPETVFTSVYYGRSLSEVMPTVGRGIVQALVCSQISIRDLDHVNSEAAQMLAALREAAAKEFAARGISLDYLGWAGTFTFSDGIQSAIDRRYIADQDQKIAAQLQPYTATIQALAAADAIRAFALRSDGKLPSTIVGLPANVSELLQSLLASPAPNMTGVK